MSEEKHKCAERVSTGIRFHTAPCSRRGVVNEDDKWWCRQHAPSAVEARNKASAARFVAESLERQKERDAVELVKRKAAAFDAIAALDAVKIDDEQYAREVYVIVSGLKP